MSLFLPFKRATLLIPSGPADDPHRKHLFILLTDPVELAGADEKHVLLVSISTIKPELPHDPTCILHAGDHPFIKHKSFVSYRLTRLEEAKKITNGVKQGIFVPQGTIETDIFARICKGLLESRQTSAKLRAFFLAAYPGFGG